MRLLDLFCGAGGAAVGYHRAGFDEIIGVDIEPQSHYPFEFVQADALEYPLDGFDLIHASPPCQRWSVGTPDSNKYPDLITPLRKRLAGHNYVIENVRNAPIRANARICGCMVDLKNIRRIRHFEIEPNILIMGHPCQHLEYAITVTGHGTTSGNRETWGRNITVAEMREAMGIDWMNRDELSQAIPPAYTEWLGKQVIPHL